MMANDPAVLVYTSGTTGMYIHNITEHNFIQTAEKM